jgi:ApbE superfamily uncharacterized protein (UPF0280 family)
VSSAARILPDGRRLHLHHGPIDMIVEAWGPPEAVAAAYRAAVARFDGLLEELVAELPNLRSSEPGPLRGPVARAMAAAVAPYRPAFVTPMAAVAGADADAVLAAMVASGGLARAYVNNGGDIALHLAPGQSLTAAVAARAGLPDRVEIGATSPVRGVATSGWRGRSWSLGIADAVTVLARTAAEADAAATMVANAVDLPGHPAVTRRPAREMQADSDLGARLVTVGVGPLSPAEVAAALDRGLAAAEAFRARGLLHAAALFLQGEVRLCGPFPAALPEKALA